MQQSPDGARLAELLAFIAVGEELSFTRAATKLGRDATVLSRRVRALEARLGVRLLERTTRAVSLTEAGQGYFQRARHILDAMDEADAAASDLAGEQVRGHLRLALPGAFGRLWVAPVVVDFLGAHPRVTIEAEFSNRYVDLVVERFDLAVRVGPLTDPGLVARRIGDRRRLLCASPGYIARHGAPQRPTDLQHHACLLFGTATGQRWTLRGRDGDTVRVPVAGRFASKDVETLQHAALAGLGVLLSSEWAIGPELCSGRLLSVLPDWTVPDEGAIHIVSPSSSHRASKTRAFSDYLAARFHTPPWGPRGNSRA